MTAGLPSLANVSEGVCRRLASLVAGQPIEVSLSPRLRAPAALVVAHRSVHLDPERAHLFDLILLAELLHRALKEEQVEDWEMWSAAITPSARRSVLERFPGASHWPGLLRKEGFPQVEEKSLEIRPLTREEASGAGGLHVAGAHVLGGEADLDALFASINERETQSFPELPGVAVLDVPLSFDGLVPDDEDREWAAEMRDRYRDSVESSIRCIQQRAEGTLEDRGMRRLQAAGGHLDAARLARLRIGRRTGEKLRVFRGRRRKLHGSFRPERHLCLLVVDLCARQISTGFGRAGIETMTMITAESYRRLGADFGIIVVADRYRHGQGYLHVHGMAKGPDEPYSPRVTARLHRLLSWELSPDDAASCWSLQARALARAFEEFRQPRHLTLNLMMVGHGAYVPNYELDLSDMVGYGAQALIEAQAKDVGGVATRPLRGHLTRNQLNFHGA